MDLGRNLGSIGEHRGFKKKGAVVHGGFPGMYDFLTQWQTFVHVPSARLREESGREDSEETVSGGSHGTGKVRWLTLAPGWPVEFHSEETVFISFQGKNLPLSEKKKKILGVIQGVIKMHSIWPLIPLKILLISNTLSHHSHHVLKRFWKSPFMSVFSCCFVAALMSPDRF